MVSQNTATAPFGNIALCLSGGGYRASTFALGTVDMLDELGLLSDVKLLSTVSGGSFTGVTYAAWLSENRTYGEFYADFYRFLKENNCVELALDDLYNTPSPSGSDDISLIRSAAHVYNDKLFKGRTFESLIEEVGSGNRFLELIFNSTEFRLGDSFRFRASRDPNVNAGNGAFNVAKDIASDVLLADIVAASSCFPGAFEPIRFPEDFAWASGLADIRERLVQNIGKWPSGFEGSDGNCISLPLMDGGIYDNQGISNAVMADTGQVFDLFFITDTSPRDDDMMQYPPPDTSEGWLSLDMLFWVAVALFTFAMVSAGMLIYYLYTAVNTARLSWLQIVFQFVSPIALFLILAGILGWIYDIFRKNKVIEVSGGKFTLWDVARHLSLPDFINMVKARITSLQAMAGDIFMKRIRQLEFKNVMEDTRLRKQVNFNLIYDLNPSTPPDIWNLAPDLVPTDELRKISAAAEAVPTTLWFDGETDLKLLVVCGQCTSCYSLLKFLWERWQDEQEGSPAPVPKPDDPASPYYDTYMKLKAVWDQLKADPNAFLDRARI
jgi:predicted acylesterase/phospholipase RssA